MVDDSSQSPLGAFRAAFRADAQARSIRPLADYLTRFPGADKAIAAAYQTFIEGGQHGTRPATEPPSADRIAHFRIIRELGRGGQATVYLAEDTRLQRQVALKVLAPGHGIDPGRLDRFRREAEIASKLNNSGICPIHEAGEDRGVLWIAMAYVVGEPLSAKIATAREHAASDSTSVIDLADSEKTAEAMPLTRKGPEPASGPKTWTEIARVLRLFEEAARIMHVAHEHGVIHRDMKPGNIMVTGDGAPVILDFGLAQDIERDLPTLTLTGDLFGTPAYMSPEQLAAHRIKLDRRTDVYSLGVSLFECLTLRRPFEAPTREGLYQAIMTKEPPDLRRLNPGLPADLRVVIATAIEKDRDRRYQSALHLAEELRRVRIHEPIVAKPVGPIVRLQRWAQRSPALAMAVAGLFAVLAIGLAVALVLLGKSESERAAKERALSQHAELLELYGSVIRRGLYGEGSAQSAGASSRPTYRDLATSVVQASRGDWSDILLSDVEPEFLVGSYYLAANQPALAEAHLMRSLEGNPRYAPAALSLARIASETSQARSIELLRRGIAEMSSREFLAGIGSPIASMNTATLIAAANDLRQHPLPVLSRTENDAIEGQLLEVAGSSDEAMACYDRALTTDPRCVVAALGMARIATSRNDLAGAGRALDRLEASARDSRWFYTRGLVIRASKHSRRELVETWKRALSLSEKDHRLPNEALKSMFPETIVVGEQFSVFVEF
jgi:serine/threonine protein kinase